MDERDFIDTVRREASLGSKEEARAVTTATLRALGERITDGQADDLARDLPETLVEPLTDVPGEAEPFVLEKFETRVSGRKGRLGTRARRLFAGSRSGTRRIR